MTFVLFFAAAAFEIGGCYLIWLAMRNGQPWLWLPAILALGLFGYLLSLAGSDSAGRVLPSMAASTLWRRWLSWPDSRASGPIAGT